MFSSPLWPFQKINLKKGARCGILMDLSMLFTHFFNDTVEIKPKKLLALISNSEGQSSSWTVKNLFILTTIVIVEILDSDKMTEVER